jgi:hypothetical protein
MWSVVIESPTFTRHLAPARSPGSAAAGARPSKNGGSRT